MFVCAQLDGNDICITVARLTSAIDGPHIIPLPEWREDILGRRYDRETGQFVEVEPPEQPEEESGGSGEEPTDYEASGE